MDWVLGTDYAGKPFDAGREAQRMVTPLGWQDIYEAVADDINNGGSGARGAATGALSLLGAGVQTIRPDGSDYPLLPEVIGRAATGGVQSLFSPSEGRAFNQSTGTPKPSGSGTPKPSKTPAPKKSATPSGGYNPFGR